MRKLTLTVFDEDKCLIEHNEVSKPCSKTREQRERQEENLPL